MLSVEHAILVISWGIIFSQFLDIINARCETWSQVYISKEEDWNTRSHTHIYNFGKFGNKQYTSYFDLFMKDCKFI